MRGPETAERLKKKSVMLYAVSKSDTASNLILNNLRKAESSKTFRKI